MTYLIIAWREEPFLFNLVVGHDVLDNCLAGRALLVLQGRDRCSNHNSVFWMSRWFLWLGSLLGLGSLWGSSGSSSGRSFFGHFFRLFLRSWEKCCDSNRAL